MSYEPVLTEDGNAIVMKDGWPLVKTPDGSEVPWNVAKQATALKDAEAEAKTRRLALEGIATDLKLQVDVRKPDGLQAVRDAVAKAPAEAADLERLRGLEAAGELGDDADAKIEARAEEKAKGWKEAAEADTAKARREAAENKAAADRSAAELNSAMTRQGLEAFHARARADSSGKLPAFREGTQQGFVLAMTTPTNGKRWTWNGKRDAAGVPVVVQVDAGTGEVVKGPDNIDPLTLGHYSKETLAQGHSYLFEPKGGDTGVDGFGVPGAKGFGEMSQADIDAAARAQVPS